jgi:hypothetical protein
VTIVLVGSVVLGGAGPTLALQDDEDAPAQPTEVVLGEPSAEPVQLAAEEEIIFADIPDELPLAPTTVSPAPNMDQDNVCAYFDYRTC